MLKFDGFGAPVAPPIVQHHHDIQNLPLLYVLPLGAIGCQFAIYMPIGQKLQAMAYCPMMHDAIGPELSDNVDANSVEDVSP